MIAFSCSMRHEVQGQAGVRRPLDQLSDLQAAAGRAGSRRPQAHVPPARSTARQQPRPGGRRGGVTLAAGRPRVRANEVSVAELLAGRPAKGRALRHRRRDRPRRHGGGPARRRLRHPPRGRRQVHARPGRAARKLRFVEEAQITGQLEHPNIVPIHELGVDGQKRLFFSMKMVKGRSLAQVLDELRREPRQRPRRNDSLGRLLNIFVSVCHALAYAHSRGVVHRDLKPANIMVGDFGEVYVMDWGLAKVLRRRRRRPRPAADIAVRPPLVRLAPTARLQPMCRRRQVVTSRRAGSRPDAGRRGHGHAGLHAAGAGRRARSTTSTQRSDVYSLGAILYEMLTLAAAHRQGRRLPGRPDARGAGRDRAAGAARPRGQRARSRGSWRPSP